jgi:DNA-directed RNA polymerase subunit K/omega
MATISSSIVTRNMAEFAKETGNVYESVAIISKRANQISVKIKEELNSKLAEFATTVDNLEEVFENREQIEISKYYERLPKPTNLAIEEFLEGKVMFRMPDAEEETSSL